MPWFDAMRLLFLLLILATGCAGGSTTKTLDGVDTSGACDTGTDPGDCPPDFTLPRADGGDFTLSDLVGTQRVIVIGTSNW